MLQYALEEIFFSQLLEDFICSKAFNRSGATQIVALDISI